MRKYAVAALLLAGLLYAFWPDDGPDDLRYSTTSYLGWNVIIFSDYPNSISEEPYSELGLPVGSGWDTTVGSNIVRNFRRQEGNPAEIRFNLIWYEIETMQAYQATIKIDARDLKLDTITKGAGLLIIRVARAGEVQAVTYKNPVNPRNAKPIILTRECGKSINIGNPEMLSNIKRLLDDLSSINAYRVDPDSVPSMCG